MSRGLFVLWEEVGGKAAERLFNSHQGAGRDRGWDWCSGEGTAEAFCSLVLFMSLEQSRRAEEL